MRKQTIGLAGALMLCGIGMLTGCGARGLEQAYSFQEREAQMTPAAGAGLAPFFASSLCVPESADGDIAPALYMVRTSMTRCTRRASRR